jgi:ADP-ribose pyrophosphatase YjhB (NUDIX family)
MNIDKKIVVRARAVILHEGKLLVVRHAHDDSFVALPGGHLEWGENIKECLQREIVEELGIKPEIGQLLYINNFISGYVQSVEFFFEVTNSDQYVNLENLERTHAHELAEVHWVESTDAIKILPKVFWDDFKVGKIISDEVRFIN